MEDDGDPELPPGFFRLPDELMRGPVPSRVRLGRSVDVDESAVRFTKWFRAVAVPHAAIRHVGFLPPYDDPVLAFWCTVPEESFGGRHPVSTTEDGLTLVSIGRASAYDVERVVELRRMFAGRWAVGDREGAILPEPE